MFANRTPESLRETLRGLARQHDAEMERLGLRAMHVSWSTPAASPREELERRLELLRKLPSLIAGASESAIGA
jgi:ribosome biogenesis protein Tsr3